MTNRQLFSLFSSPINTYILCMYSISKLTLDNIIILDNELERAEAVNPEKFWNAIVSKFGFAYFITVLYTSRIERQNEIGRDKVEFYLVRREKLFLSCRIFRRWLFQHKYTKREYIIYDVDYRVFVYVKFTTKISTLEFDREMNLLLSCDRDYHYNPIKRDFLFKSGLFFQLSAT